MRVIAESDLGIVCENGKCTGTATYIIKVTFPDALEIRLYCAQCTRRFTEGSAKILTPKNIPIHDVLEVETLLTGVAINA